LYLLDSRCFDKSRQSGFFPLLLFLSAHIKANHILATVIHLLGYPSLGFVISDGKMKRPYSCSASVGDEADKTDNSNESKAGADGDENVETQRQKDILERQIAMPEIQVSQRMLYRYATKIDIIILVISTICALAAGVAMPLMTVGLLPPSLCLSPSLMPLRRGGAAGLGT
jgi:hypothetical protein